MQQNTQSTPDLAAALGVLVNHLDTATRHANQSAAALRNARSAAVHIQKLAAASQPKGGQE